VQPSSHTYSMLIPTVRDWSAWLRDPAIVRGGGQVTRLLAAAALVVCIGVVEAAQTPTFSARTETVRVDVSVLDRGQVVRGLKAEDFELLDNGVPQRVDFAGFEDTPVSVVLALDMSGSVSGPRLEQLRAAGGRMTSALRPGDAAGLVAFSDRVDIRSRPTSDLDRLSAALQQPVAAGDTALIDATYAAMVTGAAANGRPIVIVFSDGADTASFLAPELVLDAARRLVPVVYAVTTAGAERGGFLDDLVRLTGGRRFDASLERLGDTFAAILNESRLRYLISYTPEGVARGGWHELTVRVRKRDRLEIHARPGYLGNQ
jgi:Ca-activated chloride channel family protein